MTKEARTTKSESARQDPLTFHLNFGFRYSFDIRYSDFVSIQSDGRGSRGDARFEPVLGSQKRRKTGLYPGPLMCTCL